jgi:hypothetical protein
MYSKCGHEDQLHSDDTYSFSNMGEDVQERRTEQNLPEHIIVILLHPLRILGQLAVLPLLPSSHSSSHSSSSSSRAGPPKATRPSTTTCSSATEHHLPGTTRPRPDLSQRARRTPHTLNPASSQRGGGSRCGRIGKRARGEAEGGVISRGNRG